MTEPPLAPPLPPDQPTPSRLKWIWIGVAVLYLAYFSMAFSTLEWPNGSTRLDVSQEELQLKYAVKVESIMRQIPQGSSPAIGSSKPYAQVEAVEESLRSKARESDDAAALLLAAQSLRGAELDARAIDRLTLSENPKSIALGEAFAGELADPKGIEGDGLTEKVARYRAEHPDTGPIPPAAVGIHANVALFAGIVLWLMLVVFAGLALLVVYTVLKMTGQLPVAGYQSDLTLLEADRHGGRFFVYLGLFILLSLFAELVGRALELDAVITGTAIMALMIVFVPFIAKMPIRGTGFSLRRIYGRTQKPFSLVLWGIAGFMANFPLAMGLGVIFSIFRDYLPAPHHEAIEQMMNSPIPGATAALFFVAAVAAPFVEETMFRGVLVPGLSKVLKSPSVGIILAGLMFALIHPQGPLLWPALAMIGISSAVLARQTGSLIPSIVLHACHNATILLLNVAING